MTSRRRKTIRSHKPHKTLRIRHDATLAAAITSKVEAGNFRAAVRLLCSQETVAAKNDDTFETLKAKHPAAPADRRLAAEFKGNLRFAPLEVSPEDVAKNLKTFSASSSGRGARWFDRSASV